jgi:hypothetical protein
MLVAQLVMKSFTFSGTFRFITVFTNPESGEFKRHPHILFNILFNITLGERIFLFATIQPLSLVAT